MIKARKQDSIIQMLFKKMLIFFSNPTVSLLILYQIVSDMLPPLIEVGASRSRILPNPVSTS